VTRIDRVIALPPQATARRPLASSRLIGEDKKIKVIERRRIKIVAED